MHAARRIASTVAGAAVCTLALVSCSTPKPTPTATATATPGYEQAVAKIPLAGTSRVRISWRVPAGGDQQVVLAAQRYLALGDLFGSVPDPASYSSLIDYVTTGSAASIYHQSFDRETKQDKLSGGPLWIWLDTPQRRADGSMFVQGCRDIGWWGPTAPLTAPRVDRFRYAVETLTLIPVRDNDGPPRWKVRSWVPSAAGTSAVTPQWTAGCQAWAQHKP